MFNHKIGHLNFSSYYLWNKTYQVILGLLIFNAESNTLSDKGQMKVDAVWTSVTLFAGEFFQLYESYITYFLMSTTQGLTAQGTLE